jgi:hypothetical protein
MKKENFIRWPSIDQFHNIVDDLSRVPNGIIYKCKVKLHGTNSAIQSKNGELIIQSRNRILTLQKDNYDFAKWVLTNKDRWLKNHDYIIFGEWCGKGIQNKVALAKLDKNIFVVFCAKKISTEEYIYQPELLKKMVNGIEDVYVLDWYWKEIKINIYHKDIVEIIDEVNNLLNQIEKEDPFVKELFNISGEGEGLVFYPINLESKDFEKLLFKVKTTKHQLVKGQKPMQFDPVKFLSIKEFVEGVSTEERIDGGLEQIKDFKTLKEKIEGFIKWMVDDVMRECNNEIIASKLDKEDIVKYLRVYLGRWYHENKKE